MPFGLTNTLASLLISINDVLGPFLDRFVTVFLHDILMFSDSLEEYRGQMCSILATLSKEALHLKLER